MVEQEKEDDASLSMSMELLREAEDDALLDARPAKRRRLRRLASQSSASDSSLEEEQPQPRQGPERDLLREAFDVFVQYAMSHVMDAEQMEATLAQEHQEATAMRRFVPSRETYFQPALQRLADELLLKGRNSCAVALWEDPFHDLLNNLPEFVLGTEIKAEAWDKCGACGRCSGEQRKTLIEFTLSGRPYDANALLYGRPWARRRHEKQRVFLLGLDCAARARAYHRLQHAVWHVYRRIKRLVKEVKGGKEEDVTQDAVLDELLGRTAWLNGLYGEITQLVQQGLEPGKLSKTWDQDWQ